MNTLLKTLAIAGVAFSLNTTVQASELDTNTFVNQSRAVQQKQKQVQSAKNATDAYSAQATAAKNDAKAAKEAASEVKSDLRNKEQDLINTVREDLSFFQRHGDKLICIVGTLVVSFAAISFFDTVRKGFTYFNPGNPEKPYKA